MPVQSEKLVGDLMIPIENYKVISENCTVREAIWLLKNSCTQRGKNVGRRTLIVCNDQGVPVGLINLRSIFQALEPFFVKAYNLSVPLFWGGLFTDRCREEAQKKVREIMYPINLLTLDINDPLIKAVYAMLKHKVGTLPVRENNYLVGMIRAIELFEEMTNILEEPQFFNDITACY